MYHNFLPESARQKLKQRKKQQKIYYIFYGLIVFCLLAVFVPAAISYKSSPPLPSSVLAEKAKSAADADKNIQARARVVQEYAKIKSHTGLLFANFPDTPGVTVKSITLRQGSLTVIGESSTSTAANEFAASLGENPVIKNAVVARVEQKIGVMSFTVKAQIKGGEQK